jgi:hypothetical protein
MQQGDEPYDFHIPVSELTGGESILTSVASTPPDPRRVELDGNRVEIVGYTADEVVKIIGGLGQASSDAVRYTP